MPLEVHGPAEGEPAVDFTLPTSEGSQIRLSDLQGQPVVLVFYRGHW